MREWKKFPALVLALMLPASALAQSSQSSAQESAQNSASCPAKSLVVNFDVRRFGGMVDQVPIWRLHEDSAFFFTAGLAIDADGAPNAYKADNTGLDDLSNAGQPGHWDGVLQDEEGNPLVQGPDDPFPGYYISCTALADWSKDRLDPTRFVDASKIPYIALPGELARATGTRLGDLAVVFNMRNGQYSYAIFADIGTLGEGSIALAENLGVWSDARQGGSWGGMVYVVFPGSGDHRPKSVEDINQIATGLFQTWGGAQQVLECADHRFPRHPWANWSAPTGIQPAAAPVPSGAPPEHVGTPSSATEANAATN